MNLMSPARSNELPVTPNPSAASTPSSTPPQKSVKRLTDAELWRRGQAMGKNLARNEKRTDVLMR